MGAAKMEQGIPAGDPDPGPVAIAVFDDPDQI